MTLAMSNCHCSLFSFYPWAVIQVDQPCLDFKKPDSYSELLRSLRYPKDMTRIIEYIFSDLFQLVFDTKLIRKLFTVIDSEKLRIFKSIQPGSVFKWLFCMKFNAWKVPS